MKNEPHGWRNSSRKNAFRIKPHGIMTTKSTWYLVLRIFCLLEGLFVRNNCGSKTLTHRDSGGPRVHFCTPALVLSLRDRISDVFVPVYWLTIKFSILERKNLFLMQYTTLIIHRSDAPLAPYKQYFLASRHQLTNDFLPSNGAIVTPTSLKCPKPPAEITGCGHWYAVTAL